MKQACVETFNRELDALCRGPKLTDGSEIAEIFNYIANKFNFLGRDLIELIREDRYLLDFLGHKLFDAGILKSKESQQNGITNFDSSTFERAVLDFIDGIRERILRRVVEQAFTTQQIHRRSRIEMY